MENKTYTNSCKYSNFYFMRSFLFLLLFVFGIISAQAKVSINKLLSTTSTGSIDRELWTNISGSSIADIPVNTTPASTSTLTSLEAPSNTDDNYGVRIRGYITPSLSGSYTFYIAGDEVAELWLSSDDNPAQKTKIAEVTRAVKPNDWHKNGSQKSIEKQLIAGTKYYVEVLHKEARGRDHLSVGWTGPGINSITIIDGSVLSPFSTDGSGSPGTSVALSVNKNTTHQTIDGFGFFGARDVWWGSSDPAHFYSEAWLDMIVSDLGVSIWRNELYPHNPPTGNTTPNQDAHWDKQRPMVQALKSKADQYGVDMKVILSVWSPPGEFKWQSSMTWAGDENATRGPSSDGDYYSEKNGGTLNPNKYNEFATWLSQGIQMYKDAGVNVYALSPQNEPMFAQSFNSCTYTTQWYVDMINAVIPKVNEQHPGLRIFGSENMLDMEGASHNYPYFYHNKLKTDPTALNYIDMLAVHGYLDGVSASSGSELAGYWTNHKREFSQPANKKAWMTETSGYEDAWEGGSGGSLPGALSLAIDMQTALYYGDLSAWVHWQGSELSRTIGPYVLMNDLTVGKKYYASKNFYRFIRPGAVRLATTSPDPDVSLTAYEHTANSTHTVVLINTATANKTINLAMTGSNLPTSFEMFVTSASKNCESVGNVSADGSITLPARSVVTLQAGGMPLTGSSPVQAQTFSERKTLKIRDSGELSGLAIYPNPTNNIFTVSYGEVEELNVTIFTIQGTPVNVKGRKVNGNLRFDMSGQAAGVYILKAESDGMRQTYKILIE